MSVAPLFAQVLPPAPSSARPAQADGPSDLAGLFALLLAGAPLVQAAVPGADPSVPAAPGVAQAPAGGVPLAVPAMALAQQPTPVSGANGPAALGTLPPASHLPAATAAPVPVDLTPPGSQPQPATASLDAPLPGPVATPSANLTQAGLLPRVAEPSAALNQMPGAAAPPPLTVAMPPHAAVQSERAAVAYPEMTSIALTADTTTAPTGLSLQAGFDPAGPSPAVPRLRSPAAAGARPVATLEPEARRPHVASLALSAGSAGSAGDQPAASDRAWLEPGSEAAEGAVTRADHAVPDAARGPAPGRPVAPAPVFQIGMQIAKAVPGRIDRLVVQLEPAALGRVEVRLKFHRNDQVSAVIAAERPDTLDALQRDARLLERSLQQAGLRLDSDGLTFSLKREQAHHQAREESWFAPGTGERADQPLLPVREQPPPLHWFRGLRALDIRV
jgi:hypothetical protein